MIGSTVVSTIAGAAIGAVIVYGSLQFEASRKIEAWEYTLNDLAAQAETELRKDGCVSKYMHGELEQYADMSAHGFWCDVVAHDTSRFNEALRAPVCSAIQR